MNVVFIVKGELEMREALVFIGIVFLIIIVCFAFAFAVAFCLTTPEVHGFNKFYGTDYTTMQFMFNEETYREYHGYTVTVKEN